MKNPSDDWEELRRKVLGLGDNSVRKTHYLGLRQRLAELERFRAKLQQSEAYLLEVQRLSRTGSFGWKIATGELLWSEETFRIFQYDPATKPTIEMVLQRVHPDDLAHVRQTIERASSDGKNFDHEYRLLTPDGSIKHVHAVAHAATEATGSIEFVGAVMDVTERNNANDELARLASIVASSDDAIIGKDLDGRITSWNAAATRIFGYQENEMIGRPIARIVPSELQAEENEILARLTRGERIHHYETVRVAKDGRRVDVSVTASPLRDKSGRVIGASKVARDITARRQTEKLQQALQTQLAHLGRVSTLGELTASIAHEVNQPLTGIVSSGNACLRWLAGQPPNIERASRSVERIVRDANRAGAVIGRVRGLAKKSPPQKVWLDVNEAVMDIVALTRREIRQNQIALRTQLSDEIPPVLADRIQLQQVILNLIMNAVEAMSALSDGPRELLLGTAIDELDGVRLTVADSGLGLEPDKLEDIFNAFYTTKPEGMGMGLTVSRSIIEAHGGQLWATPNLPRGAVFQITLPLDREKPG